jgi:exodeoxyribonuclease-3
MRLQVATWNVNGLRSSVGKGLDIWLHSSGNDVVCLQEVKTQADLLGSVWFPGFTAHWFDSVRSGYSGVVTLVASHLKPLAVHKGIGDPLIDSEGRLITLEFEQFEIMNVYVPHSHRELKRLDFKLRFLERFAEYIEQRRHRKSLVIVGDLNIAHEERDLANFAANRKNAGFLPQERVWLDRILKGGFRDAFRVFCDAPGHYTWWSPIKGVRERNIGWRLDYILVDQRIVGKLEACYLSPEQRGSDHCPVTAVFDI